MLYVHLSPSGEGRKWTMLRVTAAMIVHVVFAFAGPDPNDSTPFSSAMPSR